MGLHQRAMCMTLFWSVGGQLLEDYYVFLAQVSK